MTAGTPTVSGVTLPRAVTPETDRRSAAQEVINLLRNALARDDRRRHLRCPTCHRRLDEDRS